MTTRELTPALERVATLAGTVADSFEKGAELLEEMAGVRTSEATVQRTTEAAESACETVVGRRLKLAGMRWGEDGAHAVCHLRALYRGEKGQWEAFRAEDDSPN